MTTPNRSALSALLLLTAAALGRAAEADANLAFDEKTLREAKVGTDGPALLAFFKARTLSEDDRARLAQTVRLLGDESFPVRDKASKELQLAGRSAKPFLLQALKDSDAEVVRRAENCLRAIDDGAELLLVVSAARVLAARRPAGTVEALLGYVPAADQDFVEEAILEALAAAGLRDGKADAAFTAALTDREAARRLAAAYVVGRAGPEGRKAVLPLLTDADAKVRFRAADALVRGGEKAAVPALTALLSEGAPALAWQAEDLLFRLAGDKAPTASLGTGEDAARRKCREAWEGWWKANAEKVDLAKLNLEEALLGLTLVTEYDSSGARGTGRVWECGPDGKQRWVFDSVAGPMDVQALPGGRFLISEHGGNRVSERDREGNVLWEHKTNGNAVTAQRLANGNTFIATYNELLEVTRAGQVVYSHRTNNNSTFCAQKLRSGNIVYVQGNGVLTEIESASGKEVRRLTVGDFSGWAGVEQLANGNFLVTQFSGNKVVEIDGAGKVVWSCTTMQNPAWATRLRNGNTLVASCSAAKVAEFDRNGKEVWSLKTQGRPFRARRY